MSKINKARVAKMQKLRTLKEFHNRANNLRCLIYQFRANAMHSAALAEDCEDTLSGLLLLAEYLRRP